MQPQKRFRRKHCSFCFRPGAKTRKLIFSSDAGICADCVEVCNIVLSIVRDEAVAIDWKKWASAAAQTEIQRLNKVALSLVGQEAAAAHPAGAHSLAQQARSLLPPDGLHQLPIDGGDVGAAAAGDDCALLP